MELYNTCRFVTGLFPLENVLKVHPCCSMWQDFLPFLRQNDNPLYVLRWPKSSFGFFIRCYHILFIHLTVDGHLGYFHFLALMCYDAWVCKYFTETLLLILLDIYLEVGLLDYMVVLFLIFGENFIQFS